jgi:hypothetical protein
MHRRAWLLKDWELLHQLDSIEHLSLSMIAQRMQRTENSIKKAICLDRTGQRTHEDFSPAIALASLSTAERPKKRVRDE